MSKLIFVLKTVIVQNSPGTFYTQWEEQYTSDASVVLVKKTTETLEKSEWQNGSAQSIIEFKETFSAIGGEGATLKIVSGNNYHDGELQGSEKTYKVLKGVWVCV